MKVRLRCKTYDQLFNKLRDLIIGGKDVECTQPIRMFDDQATVEAKQQSYPNESSPELNLHDLPSFMRGNPWLEILSKRGRGNYDF